MKKILVIRLSAIGDIILTSPAVLNLRLSFPDSIIFFLTRPRTSHIAKLIPGVGEVIEFPENASFIDLFKMGEFLDKMAFDMIIDLHGNFRSYYLMYRVSAPIKVHYGKRRWERFKAVCRGRGKRLNLLPPHTIDLYNAAVEKAGGRIYARRPSLRLPSRSGNPRLFENDRPIIAIAPGASYPTKKWPAERFRKLASAIHNNMAANIVFILTEHERELAGLNKEIPKEQIKILINEEITNLTGYLKQADILVCNDSALSHLGSAVGTPVITLFGPTHPTLGFAPRGMKDVIIQVDEPCRPCSLHGKKPCFREEQFCFTRITVDDVLSRINKMIKEKAKGEKSIFVDRDGTLIKEKEFIKDPEKVEPEEKSIEAIRLANSHGYKVVVISNQSGVARGFFEERDVRKVNERIVKIFHQHGAIIDDILYCPHYPGGSIPEYAINCACRKPSPGMIEKACEKHNINPFCSFVIGDKLSDIQLAYVTGGRGILVRTGYGRGKEALLKNSGSLEPETVADNLFNGVNYILNLNDNR